MNKVISIISKICVVVIFAFLLLPWLFSDVIHVTKAFHAPQGKIYIMEDSKGYHALTFEDDNHMSLYHYKEDSPFTVPSIVGIKMEYIYSGSEQVGIGPIHFNPNPSIFIWKNYFLYEQGEQIRATIRLKLEKVIGLNSNLIGNVDRDGIYSAEISVFDDYILFAGDKYLLITDENDPTDYKLLWFDKYGEEIKE